MSGSACTLLQRSIGIVCMPHPVSIMLSLQMTECQLVTLDFYLV